MAVKRNFFVSVGILFWVLTITFALLPSWPHLYYRLRPQVSETLASTIASTISETPTISPSPTPSAQPTTVTPTPTPRPSPTLPEVDPSLPTENGLIIDKIGVRGQIHEGDDWEKILRTGIWRVPNFGTPEDTSHPIILAAHRWGYLNWSSAFRRLNSFYSLPQLKTGDKIKIVWGQRQYEYTVSSTTTGDKITDYTFDLILYTCQLWDSPIRYFVYATRSN